MTRVFVRVVLVLFATAVPVTAQTPPPPVMAGWSDGFVLQSGDGAYRLQLGVLVHADGRFALGDEDEAVVDSFLIRRFRPNLRGRFARRFEFYFNPDFAGGVAVIQDAYVDAVFAPVESLSAARA